MHKKYTSQICEKICNYGIIMNESPRQIWTHDLLFTSHYFNNWAMIMIHDQIDWWKIASDPLSLANKTSRKNKFLQPLLSNLIHPSQIIRDPILQNQWCLTGMTSGKAEDRFQGFLHLTVCPGSLATRSRHTLSSILGNSKSPGSTGNSFKNNEYLGHFPQEQSQFIFIPIIIQLLQTC